MAKTPIVTFDPFLLPVSDLIELLTAPTMTVDISIDECIELLLKSESEDCDE